MKRISIFFHLIWIDLLNGNQINLKANWNVALFLCDLKDGRI